MYNAPCISDLYGKRPPYSVVMGFYVHKRPPYSVVMGFYVHKRPPYSVVMGFYVHKRPPYSVVMGFYVHKRPPYSVVMGFYVHGLMWSCYSDKIRRRWKLVLVRFNRMQPLACLQHAVVDVCLQSTYVYWYMLGYQGYNCSSCALFL